MLFALKTQCMRQAKHLEDKLHWWRPPPKGLNVQHAVPPKTDVVTAACAAGPCAPAFWQMTQFFTYLLYFQHPKDPNHGIHHADMVT